MKTCRLCGRTLRASAFHKDIKSKDGLSARCAECRNSLKTASKRLKNAQAIPLANTPEKTIVEALEGQCVDVCESTEMKISIEDQSDILNQVRKKYNCHFSLSIDRNGNSRLQVHQNPTLVFKSDTPEGVIQNALAFS